MPLEGVLKEATFASREEGAPSLTMPRVTLRTPRPGHRASFFIASRLQ